MLAIPIEQVIIGKPIHFMTTHNLSGTHNVTHITR